MSGALFPGLKWPVREADCLPSAEFFFLIYTLFTLHATLQVSNTTCIVVTYLYSSLPFYL